MDFPKNILEFQRRFSTNNACWNYLRRIRWPKGFNCPYDGTSSVGFTRTRSVWQCEKGHQISVTTGTVMHGSHIPLQKWFWAAYLVSTSKTGLSAWELHEQIGVHYETAYMMLQRLRAGMVCPERVKIGGNIEMDEAFVSAGRMRKTKRKKSGWPVRKPIVVCAVQSRGKFAGQVRLRRVQNTTADCLQRFALDYVIPGSNIITDGNVSYHMLSGFGFRHTVRRGKNSVEVAKQLPHIHRVFSNLKAWLIGTHHGVSAKHLQAYLNEFAFRYNHRGNLFRAFKIVLGLSSIQEGPEYEQLYNAGSRGGWRHPTTKQCA